MQSRGYAIQCRVTTEDPANNFMPDYGRITHYRSASGMGIRLDAGTAFSGAVVTPFYDSLLVKVTAKGMRFVDAARRMERCLQEFRVRGVKTNIPFLINLITHPTFSPGAARRGSSTRRPSCSNSLQRKDRATKLLTFLGDVIVNGNPLVKNEAGEDLRGSGAGCRNSTSRSRSRPEHGRSSKSWGPKASASGSSNRTGC